MPFFGFAQPSGSEKIASQDGGFEISGNITGYNDGTSVSFLNEQTGVPEKQTTIEKGKFIIKGKLEEPSFRILVFGDQPPAVPLFIDNSKIKITGDKSSLDKLSVTGSATHSHFADYSSALKPYEKVFMPDSHVMPNQ